MLYFSLGTVGFLNCILVPVCIIPVCIILNYPLFLMNCVTLPLCIKIAVQQMKQSSTFFNVVDLVLYVAYCLLLNMHLLGSSWLNSPPLTRLQCFLYGHLDVSLSINIKLFSLVQDYVINSWRLC